MVGTNSVTAKYVSDDNYDYLPYGIFSKKSLTFKGSGALTSTGGAKSEIDSGGIGTFGGNITLNSGMLTAKGGSDCCSYGIYTGNIVYVKGGTLNATGGTLYGPEDESISTGIWSAYLVVSGGTLNAAGGSAGKYTSAGFASRLRMTGGTVTAKGGSAGVISAGAYCDDVDGQIIIGGTAKFTGGTCSKGSYGFYNYYTNADLQGYDDDGNPYQMDPPVNYVHSTAKVTAAGNTASTNVMFDYDYYGDMILDYIEDDDESDWLVIGGDDDDGDDIDDEETVVNVGGYYIYSDTYAPVINAGSNVNGTGTERYVSPDPNTNLYTNRKYVNIVPAVLPTSIKLSQNTFKDGRVGDTKQLKVDYIPTNADIKAVNWTSSQPNIATVSSTGLVTIIGNANYGYSDITAKIGKCSAICRVSYQKPQVVNPTISITYVGSEPVIRTKEGTLKINATVTPSNYASQLSWSVTGSTAVASFDKTTGIVTGHANGTIVLKAYLSGNTDVYALQRVDVNIPADPDPTPDPTPDPQCQHTSITGMFIAATRDEDGSDFRMCVDCDAVLTSEVIPRVSTIKLTNSNTNYDYTGQPITPAVTVCDREGKVLKSGKEYNLYYYNNTEPGEAYACVELKAHYTGTYNLYYTIVNPCRHPSGYTEIVPAEMGEDGSILTKCSNCRETLESEPIPYVYEVGIRNIPYLYTGKPVMPELRVVDKYGKDLKQGTDYDFIATNNINVGEAKCVFVLKGMYTGTFNCGFLIKPATVENGAISLKKTTLDFSAQTVLPEVVLRNGYNADDFHIEYVDPENMSVGKHSVVITSTNYDYNKTLTYTVRPAGTKLGELKPAKKAAKIKWAKQAQLMDKTRIDGYEIQYSLKKSFKKAEKVRVKGYAKTSVKLKKLKSGKKYYVRIRTYKKVDGKTYYSKWSKTRKVKPQ